MERKLDTPTKASCLHRSADRLSHHPWKSGGTLRDKSSATRHPVCAALLTDSLTALANLVVRYEPDRNNRSVEVMQCLEVVMYHLHHSRLGCNDQRRRTF